MIRSIIVFCISTLALNAFGEQVALERWTLEKVVTRASEQTPEIYALEKDIERAENLAQQAGKWDNPEASVAYGPMTQSGLSGRALDVSVKQSIPLFGQKAIAERLGEQNRTTIEAENKKQRLFLKHEVVRLAYRLSALEEQAKHIEHRREKIGLIAKFLETRPFASPSQAVEKNLLMNRLREVEEKFLDISLAEENAWRALNVFLNLESRIIPDVQWIGNAKPIDREGLWELCQSQNPDLQRGESMIAAAALEAEQAAKRGLPEIKIGGNYNEQTADFPQKIYAGTIDFTLPIFDRGGYAKQAALAGKEAASRRLEQKRRELKSQFDQAWMELAQGKKRIELYPLSLVEDLESQMKRAEQNWKRGLVQVTAFLELENQVHEQAVKVFNAQIAYIEAASQMQFLAGNEFKTEGN